MSNKYIGKLIDYFPCKINKFLNNFKNCIIQIHSNNSGFGELMFFDSNGNLISGDKIESVSYTHLDVYKRQFSTTRHWTACGSMDLLPLLISFSASPDPTSWRSSLRTGACPTTPSSFKNLPGSYLVLTLWRCVATVPWSTKIKLTSRVKLFLILCMLLFPVTPSSPSRSSPLIWTLPELPDLFVWMKNISTKTSPILPVLSSEIPSTPPQVAILYWNCGYNCFLCPL